MNPIHSAGYKLVGIGVVTLRKLECSKQANALNTRAWNKRKDSGSILLVFGT